MASIREALEDSIAEHRAFLKHVICAIPVFFSYMLFSKGDINTLYILGSFTFLVLLTMLIKTMRNVVNKESYTVPKFDIKELGKTAAKSLIAAVPSIVAVCFIAKILTDIQIPLDIPNIQVLYSIAVWLFLSGFMVTSLILYSKDENIKDAYNIKSILANCGDVMVAVIFYIPQLLILNAAIVGTIMYIFKLYTDLNNPIFIFICCIALSIDVTITGHYFGQLDYDIISRQKD